MKKTFTGILLIVSLSVFGQARFPIHTATGGTPAPTDVAIIHYGFNDDGIDDSGNGHDASTTNMIYDGTNKAEGSHSGNFNSTSILFEIPSIVTWGPTFSISCWVLQSNDAGYYEIMSPYQNSSWEYWRVWMHGPNKSWELRGYQNTTNTLNNSNTNNSVWVASGSTWIHVVIIYESNGTVTFYNDGVLLTMIDGTTWDTSNMKIDHVNMYIGRYFLGLIDDFSMYDQGLSQANVTTLYNGGVAGTILTSF